MCRFIESIRVAKGKVSHLAVHQSRMDSTAQHFFGRKSEICLDDLVHSYLHDPNHDYLFFELYKMRLVYSQKVEQVTFHRYTLPLIKSLQCVEDDSIDYSFKYLDRSPLEQLFSRKGACDDILVIKNGCVTDSSYANVAFFDGHDWCTPQNPLLKGVQREVLLEENRIKLTNITLRELALYTKVRLFNAMIRWEDELDIEMSDIHLPLSVS